MKNNGIIFSALLVTAIFINKGVTQDTIFLKNPSFEGLPMMGTSTSPPIDGWKDCGYLLFPTETPPDIHSAQSKGWNVAVAPYDGKTYLGMVVRYNGTFESISQRLDTPLQKDSCYSFSVCLDRSVAYKSGTRRSAMVLENFTNSVILRLWAGNLTCKRQQLLAQSAPVDHSFWKQYTFTLSPNENYYYLMLEVYFTDETTVGYNGHILIDNLSPIIKIACQ